MAALAPPDVPTSVSHSDPGRARRPRPGCVEFYVPPSAEAERLIRWIPGLVCATSGPGKFARDLLVAPFTQLTFVSFDLQHFLFRGMHQTWMARIGHWVGMSSVVLFGLRGASDLTADWPVDGGACLSGGLLVWWAVVAREARLPGWWLASAGYLGALVALSTVLPVGSVLPWVVVSAFVVAISHTIEELFPPRAGHDWDWMPFHHWVWSAGSWSGRVRRAVRVAGMVAVGVPNEFWASWRLLPYNLLEAMFALGYAPERRAELHDRVERAWASGNPAVDFVGVGGGAVLQPPAE